MCLTIDLTIHPDCQPHIATHDIPVYKILRVVNRFLRSPYMGHPYVKDQNMTRESVKIEEQYGDKVVAHGYHSYVNWEMCHGNLMALSSDRPENHNFYYKVFNAIIPQGTKYFQGRDGDMVSETIKIPEYVLRY